MPKYDSTQSESPAPIAIVELQASNGKSVQNVRMLLDTGADVSLIPRECADALELTIEQQNYELIGFDGSRAKAEAVTVKLKLLDKTVRGQFLVSDQTQGILGRNVLNHFWMLFDGPNQNWECR
jgi:hypothetical protein